MGGRRKLKLRVRVQPGARKDEILGFREGILWVKVSAPPIEGKANGRLIDLLSKRLSIPKSRIRIVRGETSRNKELEIEGLGEDEVFGALGSGDKVS